MRNGSAKENILIGLEGQGREENGRIAEIFGRNLSNF